MDNQNKKKIAREISWVILFVVLAFFVYLIFVSIRDNNGDHVNHDSNPIENKSIFSGIFKQGKVEKVNLATKEFSSSAGFSIVYPEDWSVTERASSNLSLFGTGQGEGYANNAQAINLKGPEVKDSNMQESIDIIPETSFYGISMNNTPKSSNIDQYWNNLLKFDQAGNAIYTFRETRMVNGKNIAIVDYHDWKNGKPAFVPHAFFLHNDVWYWVKPSVTVKKELFDSLVNNIAFKK